MTLTGGCFSRSVCRRERPRQSESASPCPGLVIWLEPFPRTNNSSPALLLDRLQAGCAFRHGRTLKSPQPYLAGRLATRFSIRMMSLSEQSRSNQHESRLSLFGSLRDYPRCWTTCLPPAVLALVKWHGAAKLRRDRSRPRASDTLAECFNAKRSAGASLHTLAMPRIII